MCNLILQQSASCWADQNTAPCHWKPCNIKNSNSPGFHAWQCMLHFTSVGVFKFFFSQTGKTKQGHYQVDRWVQEQWLIWTSYFIVFQLSTQGIAADHAIARCLASGDCSSCTLSWHDMNYGKDFSQLSLQQQGKSMHADPYRLHFPNICKHKNLQSVTVQKLIRGYSCCLHEMVLC